MNVNCSPRRDGYWEECHWGCCNHCGMYHHDHRPWYLKALDWEGWSVVWFWVWTLLMLTLGWFAAKGAS